MKNINDKLSVKKYIDLMQTAADFRFNVFDMMSALVYATHSMIFKTFDSDIDKLTSKIGIFGKSFNTIFDVKNQRKIDIDDLIVYKGMSLDNAEKQIGSFWNYLYPKKEDIQKQLIDVNKLS